MRTAIAIVDVDPERRERVVRALGEQGFDCRPAGDIQALLDGDAAPGLVLLFPGAHGLVAGTELGAAMGALRSHTALGRTPCIVVGAAGGELTAVSALRLGAADWVDDAVGMDELGARIDARIQPALAVDELCRRQQGMALVLELTRALSSSLSLRDILFSVVRRIAEVVEVDRVSIVVGGDDDTAYVVAASDDKTLRDLPIKLSDYPEIMRTLESGAPTHIEDATDHPLFDLGAIQGPRRFRSLLLFPILFEDRPMGVLFLRWQERRVLRDDDVFLLRAIANATGIALRNARLLESLRAESRQSRFAHVEAERQLKAVQRFVDFFDSSADGIVVVGRDGQVLFSNPAASAITGRAAAELRQGPFDAMLTRDGAARFAELKPGFAEGVFPDRVDLPIRTPEGKRRMLDVSFSTVAHERDAVIVSFRDVTEERSLGRELTQTKEFLQRVIDSSVDSIVSADMAGTVLLFNPAAERTYGYSASEVVGRMNVRDLYPIDQARHIMRLIRDDEHGPPGSLDGYETALCGHDGELIPVLLSAALIMDRGRAIGSVGVFRDLRAEKQIEARLAHTERQLELQEKKALIAELAGATAHELNQPLTAVMGYAGIIARRAADDPRLCQVAERIVAESERMADIVRKIGKLTRYETKAYVGDTKIIDIDRSIDNDPPITGY